MLYIMQFRVPNLYINPKSIIMLVCTHYPSIHICYENGMKSSSIHSKFILVHMYEYASDVCRYVYEYNYGLHVANFGQNFEEKEKLNINLQYLCNYVCKSNWMHNLVLRLNRPKISKYFVLCVLKMK